VKASLNQGWRSVYFTNLFLNRIKLFLLPNCNEGDLKFNTGFQILDFVPINCKPIENTLKKKEKMERKLQFFVVALPVGNSHFRILLKTSQLTVKHTKQIFAIADKCCTGQYCSCDDFPILKV